MAKTSPQCDADWYRDILRSTLKSLVLPKKLIEEYFENIGYEADDKYAQKYIDRFNRYFGTDIKPLPADWLCIGYRDKDKSLKISKDILRLAGSMDRNKLVNIISWLLSGFIKHFDIFCPGRDDSLIINSALRNAISGQYPDYSGKGSLPGRWFEEIYRAKFLSVRIPERLLKGLFI